MSQARALTGLDVCLKLQLLARVTSARSVVLCVWNDGDVVPMSSISSPYVPARSVAGMLVTQCQAEGIITAVAGGDWGFKLDGRLSPAAVELLERLEYLMAVASTQMCGPGCGHRIQRPAAARASGSDFGMKKAVRTMPEKEKTKSLRLVGSKRLPLREIVTSIRTSPTPKNMMSLVLAIFR